MAEAEEAVAEYGVRLLAWDELKQVDGVILAVPHRHYLQMDVQELLRPLRRQRNSVVVDVKGALGPDKLPGSVRYWRL